MALSGIQQAIAAAIKSAAENLPPEIQENILQIGAKVADFQARLERIEKNQALIISLLHGKATTDGTEPARQLANGSGEPRSA